MPTYMHTWTDSTQRHTLEWKRGQGNRTLLWLFMGVSPQRPLLLFVPTCPYHSQLLTQLNIIHLCGPSPLHLEMHRCLWIGRGDTDMYGWVHGKLIAWVKRAFNAPAPQNFTNELQSTLMSAVTDTPPERPNHGPWAPTKTEMQTSKSNFHWIYIASTPL